MTDTHPMLGVSTGPNDDAILLSGTDGSRLHEWISDDFKLLKQEVVETAAIGDVNDDGFADVVIGRNGSVSLMSGKDDTLLAEMSGSGGLGVEIESIGDLNGDGISEILASAPAGEYALVISFALKKDPAPSQITLTIEDGKPVITWSPDLTKGTLERSPDLLNWSSVIEIDTIDVARYPISDSSDGSTHYYRIRVAAE